MEGRTESKAGNQNGFFRSRHPLADSADASLPLNEIASRVGLSPTPCWNRIRKMEETGIISRRVAVLDAARLGLGVTIFVSIETSDHSEGWLARFAEAVKQMPEVVDVYRMSGMSIT